MANRKYFHVIEQGHYGDIGHQGCYDTLDEAREEANRLSNIFMSLDFYVMQTDSSEEPEICTI